MLQSIQSFDMFSQPFQFQFKGRDVGKKTMIGTFFSVLVWILAILYLVYLLVSWFSDNMNPTVIVQTNYIASLDYTFTLSPILIKINTGEESLGDEGQYFQYEAFAISSQTSKFEASDIDTKDCDDITNQFERTEEHTYNKGYVCINPTDTSGNQILNLKVNQDGTASNIRVQQKACNPGDGGLTCSSFDDIKALMSNPFFKIEVLLVYYEFDFTTSSLSQKFRKIVLPGDYNNVSYYTFYTEVSKIKEDKGWLWSSITEYSYISGYDIDLQLLSGDYAFTKLGAVSDDIYFSSFGFELILRQIETSVEHVKLSTVLAMFSSIFNSLLLIGIIAQLNSKAQIYQDMSDVYLKEYYKITAEQLVQHELDESKKKAQQKSLKKLKTNSEIILEAAQKRRRELTTFFRVYIPDSWQEKKQNKISDPGSINPDRIYKVSIDKAIENMTASKLFAEIYHLKTAVQLLFTEEQYAALFYVGRAIPQDYVHRERNHLENNDYLEENVEIREEYLQKFLDNIENGKDDSYLSKMIQNSLLQSVRNHDYQTGFFQSKGFGLGGRKSIFLSEKKLDRQDDLEKYNSKENGLVDINEEEDDKKQDKKNNKNSILDSAQRLAENVTNKVQDKLTGNEEDNNNKQSDLPDLKKSPSQLPPLEDKRLNQIKQEDHQSQNSGTPKHRVQKSQQKLIQEDNQSHMQQPSEKQSNNNNQSKQHNTQEDEFVILNNQVPLNTDQDQKR